ncbi:MAG TPA: serine/threonine-protein kinase [Gemmatimonadaceae bacterium]|nr:serine/threonine-protein kinase [Gemmatimonadaceae bacterium]
MMRCLQCTTEIPNGMHVCTQCGYRAGASEATLVLTGGDETLGPQESLLDVVRCELSQDYEVEMELARGGMAVVFRATEIELARQVALKVLPPEMALSQSMANRFKREARMAASLEHPNIIPIYRVGQAGRLFFITMKYIDGRALSSLIESQGPLPAPVVWHVLRGCASALAHAHEHGIIHRDIKGANILMDTEGHVIVSDFGVARALEDASMTASGSVIGTPHFMSPEQCAGKHVAPQSDQYSLGVLGFQMLTGHIPFDADTIAAVMHHHFFTPIPPLGSARPDAPQAMVDVINRALSKSPKQRFGTTAEMLAAIESIPLTDADRRYGEAMLRELAAGATIPRVATGELPPLPEVIQLSGPVPVQFPGFTPSDELMTPAGSSGTPRTPLPARGFAAAAWARVAGVAAGAAVVTGLASVWLLASAPANAVGGADSLAAPLLSLAAAESLRSPGSRATAPTTIADAATRGAPSAAAPASGYAWFRGLPGGASVTVAGRTLAGGRGELPPGRYDYRVSAPDHLPQAGTIDVRPGETASVDVDLRRREAAPVATGALRLRVYPTSAMIVVDDRPLGQGIVMDSVLAAGPHRLVVTAPGFVPFDTTFTIDANQTTTLPPIKLQEIEPTS